MRRETFFKLAGPGLLCGLTLPDWADFLQEEWKVMSPRCLPRIFSITAQSLQNSVWERFERRCEENLDKVRIRPPIFILGHWRSGTTFLHELLAQDPQFGFPTTYQVSFPKTFLASESRNAGILDRIIPRHRPMDRMELTMRSPQEDEFALCSLTRLSPCMSWVFPREKARFQKYLTFRQAEEKELNIWKNALLWFLKKVQLRDPRPLVLKSPPHTARIKLLMELFPEARFIHIHRHPFEVFQSSVHLFTTIVKWHRLQTDCDSDLDNWIFAQHNEMFDAFFEEWPAIPHGQSVETNLEALEQAPLSELKRIYDSLGLDGYAQLEKKAALFLETRKHYTKNQYAPLSREKRNGILRQWERSFERWGYKSP